MNDQDLYGAIIGAWNLKDWPAVVVATQPIVGRVEENEFHHFVRAVALFELGRIAEAREQVEFTITHFGRHLWSYVLRANIRVLDGADEATFLREAEASLVYDEDDAIRPAFTDLAIRSGFFDAAKRLGEARQVAREGRAAARYALVIQCFNKPDLLEAVLTHAHACDAADLFDLVVIQDSNVGSMHPEKYARGSDEVAAVLAAWLPRLLDRFCAVDIIRNRRNLGTAPTCRKALDRTTRSHDGFVFIEDDCLLSKDALVWSRAILDANVDRDDLWFASCESPCFRTWELVADDALVARGQALSQEDGVRDAFFLVGHVPSTCFITSTSVWQRCAAYRGMPRGPESLSSYLAHAGGKTILPIVPRASDVGAFHDNAYTLGVHGDGVVRSAKNTYLLSERTDVMRIAPYEGDVFDFKRRTSTRRDGG